MIPIPAILLAVAPALPLGKSGKFVAGAYVVFLGVILLYVAIMAIRAQRLERDLDQLRRDVEAVRAAREGGEDNSEQTAATRGETGSLL